VTASRTRLAAAAALVAAAVIAGALLLAGGAQGDEGRLAWQDVQIYEASKKTDRILGGKVRNTSLEDLEIDVTDVRMLDASGREVRSALRFREAFAHGIFPWSQKPDDIGDFERRRLGEIVKIRPGQSAPLTLSWRVPEGGEPPVRVDFGPVELDLPRSKG
jgi:hypothetical protein